MKYFNKNYCRSTFNIDCLYPIWVSNPKYGGSFNNPADPMYFQVPCGHCELCLSRKRAAWNFRLRAESKVASSTYFVTLTYDDGHLPSSGSLDKRDCQLFLKRFRKALPRGTRIRYFLAGEYGGQFGRPHYHMFLFNYPSSRDSLVTTLKKTWKNSVPEQFDRPDTVANVTPASINYVCKYCLSNLDRNDSKQRQKLLMGSQADPREKAFLMCSKGIGLSWLTPAMLDYLRRDLRRIGMVDGLKSPLPRYYHDKVYDDEMKYEMLINTIIKNEQDLAKYLENFGDSDRGRDIPIWKQRKLHKAERIRRKIKNQ